MRLRHFVLTNFNVALPGAGNDKGGRPLRTEEWLEHRMELFERWCLPTMERRTDRDAIWLVRHARPESDVLARRLASLEERGGLRLVSAEWRFRDAIVATLEPGDDFVLTTRLDNDDGLHPEALERLRTFAAESLRRGTREPVFLDLPVGYSVSDPGGEARLLERPSNHFLSLLEPAGPGRIRTARCIAHSRARELAPLRTVCREPMWIRTVHDRNLVNALTGSPVDLDRVLADFGYDSRGPDPRRT